MGDWRRKVEWTVVWDRLGEGDTICGVCGSMKDGDMR